MPGAGGGLKVGQRRAVARARLEVLLLLLLPGVEAPGLLLVIVVLLGVAVELRRRPALAVCLCVGQEARGGQRRAGREQSSRVLLQGKDVGAQAGAARRGAEAGRRVQRRGAGQLAVARVQRGAAAAAQAQRAVRVVLVVLVVQRLREGVAGQRAVGQRVQRQGLLGLAQPGQLGSVQRLNLLQHVVALAQQGGDGVRGSGRRGVGRAGAHGCFASGSLAAERQGGTAVGRQRTQNLRGKQQQQCYLQGGHKISASAGRENRRDTRVSQRLCPFFSPRACPAWRLQRLTARLFHLPVREAPSLTMASVK